MTLEQAHNVRLRWRASQVQPFAGLPMPLVKTV
jgi:hypothetical protein